MNIVRNILITIINILKVFLMNILLGQPFIYIPLYIGKIFGFKTELSVLELEFLALAVGCVNWGMIYSYKFWFKKE